MISLNNVKGAVVSALIAGLITALSHIVGSGDVLSINWSLLLNVSIIAAAASLLKSLGTDGKGVFAGAVRVR